MENIKEKLNELENSLFDGLDFESLEQVIIRLEKYKELADQAKDWKHRVGARKYFILIGQLLDRLEMAMLEMTWLAGQWDQNREEVDLENAMSYLEDLVEYLPSFPNISRRDIEFALEKLEDWLNSNGREPHYLHWARFKTYKRLGDEAKAEQHKSKLIGVEREDPLVMIQSTSCDLCHKCRVIYYYTSIGLMDKALELARDYIANPIKPCMTGPRTGFAHLLDALLDAGRLEDAETLLPVLNQHLDHPTKAPVRIALPLLRYYLESKNDVEAEKMIAEYTPIADKIADRWTAMQFHKLVSGKE
jgi:hypothetical protein